jgi:large subunit ribosomal protein L15
MARRPAGDPKGRILVLGEGPKQVLRAVRCPSSAGFPREGFVRHLRNTLPSSMWEISIVFQKTLSWNPICCFNPAFKKEEPVKLLADGELQHPLTVRVHQVSKAALKKVESASGRVEVIGS